MIFLCFIGFNLLLAVGLASSASVSLSADKNRTEELLWNAFSETFHNVPDDQLTQNTERILSFFTKFYLSSRPDLTRDSLPNIIPISSVTPLLKFRTLFDKVKTSVKLGDTHQSGFSGRVPFNATFVGSTTSSVCNLKVVGYYGSNGSTVATPKMLSYYTHMIFAFVEVTPTGSLWLNSNYTKRLTELMTLKNRIKSPTKILLAVGGADNSQHFPSLIRNQSMQDVFEKALQEILARYNLDGVDIDWEFPGKMTDDALLFVKFMKRLRELLDSWKAALNKDYMFLTFAGPSIEEQFHGFDIPGLLEGSTVDWVNIMSYDFYAPFNGTTGFTIGPSAALFSDPADNKTHHSSKSVHSAVELYLCKTNQTDKLVVGVPFYGHYWEHVDFEHFRVESESVSGGFVRFANKSDFMNRYNFTEEFNDKLGAVSAWDEAAKVYYTYEIPKSVEWKAQYILQSHLGGVMVWTADSDDQNLSLIQAITNGNMCGERATKLPDVEFSKECPEVRWWTELMDPANAGKCGINAPLLNGKYPVCNPNEERYACCGPYGYCGSGTAYCDCLTCVDYAKKPQRVMTDNVPPDPNRKKLWWTLQDGRAKAGKCGEKAPTINGKMAICDPLSVDAHCCSAYGYCGSTSDHCDCPTCLDFSRRARKIESFEEPLKENLTIWYTPQSSPETIGRCGTFAPLINGVVPICNPGDPEAHCCSRNGYCGTGPEYCNCPVCTDFTTFPDYRFPILPK